MTDQTAQWHREHHEKYQKALEEVMELLDEGHLVFLLTSENEFTRTLATYYIKSKQEE